MRKIPRDIESPIDDLVLQMTEKSGLMESFYALGLSPNMLTTIGNLFRALSIYYYYQTRPILFFASAFMGFIFDCFDGHFARQYNLSTNFGDYYDHVSDLVYHLILGYIIYKSTRFQDLIRRHKIMLIIVVAISFILFLMHMGCQEHYFDCDQDRETCSATLGIFTRLCSSKESINWTKYFGTGTFVVFIYLLAIWSMY